MLKPEQYEAIYWLSQPKHGGLSQEEIASKCGVSRQTLHKWRQSDAFQNELRKEISRYAMHRMPEVVNAMVESAISLKSAAAAKLLMQSCGFLESQLIIDDKRKKEEESKLPDLEEMKRILQEVDDDQAH